MSHHCQLALVFFWYGQNLEQPQCKVGKVPSWDIDKFQKVICFEAGLVLPVSEYIATLDLPNNNILNSIEISSD